MSNFIDGNARKLRDHASVSRFIQGLTIPVIALCVRDWHSCGDLDTASRHFSLIDVGRHLYVNCFEDERERFDSLMAKYGLSYTSYSLIALYEQYWYGEG